MAEVRLERQREVDGAAEVHGPEHARGVLDARRAWSAGKEDDRRAREQPIAIDPEKLEGEVLHRDDEVESLPGILRADEILERRLVHQVGEAPGVQVLGVIIEPLGQPILEEARQLAFADDRHLRVAPVCIEDEHRLLFRRSQIDGRADRNGGQQREQPPPDRPDTHVIPAAMRPSAGFCCHRIAHVGQGFSPAKIGTRKQARRPAPHGCTSESPRQSEVNAPRSA